MVSVAEKEGLLELAGYMKRMASRLEKLQQTSTHVSGKIDKFSKSIGVRKQGLKREIGDVKEEFASLRNEAKSLQKATLIVIAQLKNCVQADEFSRLKNRIELWNPESFITKREAKRVLKRF